MSEAKFNREGTVNETKDCLEVPHAKDVSMTISGDHPKGTFRVSRGLDIVFTAGYKLRRQCIEIGHQ